MQDTLSKPGADIDVSEELCNVLCSSVGKLCQLLGQEQPSELLQQRLQVPLRILEVHCCVLWLVLAGMYTEGRCLLRQQQQQQERRRRRRGQQHELLLPLASACNTVSAALEQQQQQQQQAAAEQQQQQQALGVTSEEEEVQTGSSSSSNGGRGDGKAAFFAEERAAAERAAAAVDADAAAAGVDADAAAAAAAAAGAADAGAAHAEAERALEGVYSLLSAVLQLQPVLFAAVAAHSKVSGLPAASDAEEFDTALLCAFFELVCALAPGLTAIHEQPMRDVPNKLIFAWALLLPLLYTSVCRTEPDDDDDDDELFLPCWHRMRAALAAKQPAALAAADMAAAVEAGLRANTAMGRMEQLRLCCNHTGCANLGRLSEAELVAGRGCVCGRCFAARYCSKECQVAAWPLHRRMCKAIQHERQQQQQQQPQQPQQAT
ncbi:hypothetical protein OEZ85_011189 [Tetradesmus obliquus]|uniref:MYND-type domain-containing protein n=1 Tax=Tetradesmus obliquus TaxID=3088 RepID=A0ABY8TPI8_TETOB|nr:hypothetical protein OEZ85_011189 [Tetradesmus obliquus]